METKEAIGWMREKLEEDEQKNGVSQYTKDHIFRLFDVTEKYASDSLTLRESRHKAELETDLEVFRSVFTYGQAALRTTITINGGAAIAVLAFLARYVGSPSIKVDIGHFLTSLLIFGLGVFIGAFTTGFTYLAQYCFAHQHNKFGLTFQVVSILMGISAIFCFGGGVWYAYSGFLPSLNA